MTAERDAMTLNEVSYSAPGAEERSDEAPGAGRPRPGPDPEVVAKPKRRQFSAQYRLRILEEADRCTRPGEVGRLLRREGLYSSHLTAWRKARRKSLSNARTAIRYMTPKSRRMYILQSRTARQSLPGAGTSTGWATIRSSRNLIPRPRSAESPKTLPIPF